MLIYTMPICISYQGMSCNYIKIIQMRKYY